MTRTPLIIGHRGASSIAPENTVAAFQSNLETGSDGVEFDVQLSRDGVPVVIHDFDLRRTAGRRVNISDLTARELATTDVGSWFNSRFPTKASASFATETVPTLVDVLALLAESKGLIYVELKCRNREGSPLAKAVCDIIRDSPLLPRIIVKSFSLELIPQVRSLLTEVKTAILFEPTILGYLRRRNNLLTIAGNLGADQISIHYSLLTPNLAKLAGAAGVPVTVWTVDNPIWLAKANALGVRALITNDPGKLIAVRDAG